MLALPGIVTGVFCVLGIALAVPFVATLSLILLVMLAGFYVYYQRLLTRQAHDLVNWIQEWLLSPAGPRRGYAAVKDMTDQKRQSQPILSVDFVTALSLDECRERSCSTPIRRRGSMSPCGTITASPCAAAIPTSDQAVARFWGTLEPRERGTWVWGTSIEEASEIARNGPRAAPPF